ncbi:VWA domain-containing protein [Bradyrhizobium genosp. L]|uniref:nitric oxide reductase activation protein NorD n=1 Tax=Bradyrhizobium genosp. L TaxID=83637 RepID=UPI0018A2BD45|nr:VWA domain-containing protein [Bradyrhizobium genosp. L]QPF87284.1 VWA domain-containing protein [Bradyrhizobium genosp. L]
MAVAHISSLENIRSGRRLAEVLRGHDDIGTAVRTTRATLEGRPELANRLAIWDVAVRGLFEANLGEAVVFNFLRLSEHWPAQRSAHDLLAIGRGAADIGRSAGSRVAHAALTELSKVLPRLAGAGEVTTVLAALCELADAGPESVGLAIVRLEQLLGHASAEDFSAWVSAGLRASGGRAARRRAYFALDDALSARLFALGRTSDDFARLEKRLAATMTALWNRKPRFRKLAIAPTPVPRRTSLAGGLVGLPETFAGFDGARADAIYLAAVAHAGAHFVHSTARFPVGRLKALQLALVSLIEDARVETLALREMPGLRRLWLPFHTATPSGQATAAGLMTRLARALIDPGYQDSDGWVAKGRALFVAASDRWSDPAISREIGGLLGNDIGQMRLQFNAKSYVVEPAYRDDNLALWDFGDQPDSPTETIELAVDSVRIEQREDATGPSRDDDAKPDETLRARASQVTLLDGLPVATYPEWDYAADIDRMDWTTILEADAAASAGAVAPPAESEAMRSIARLTRDASIGRRLRLKGQRDGDALDIDAAIALAIERRAGHLGESRVYQRDAPGPRDLAILLLMDLSQSTADRDRAGRTVLDVERKAAAIMATAVNAANDAIAVHGFSSDGRERVRYLRVKGFDEPMDAVVHSRLARLASGHSTRLGTALRHAGGYLAGRRAFRKVLLVLTDGEPSDIDVPDPQYLTEDARRAAQQLRRGGIDIFAFGIGGGRFHQLDRIFGERRALRVPRIDVLPQRVMQLYAELKK